MEMLERSVWRDVDVVLYPSAEETGVTDIEPDGALAPYAAASRLRGAATAEADRPSCSSAALRTSRTGVGCLVHRSGAAADPDTRPAYYRRVNPPADVCAGAMRSA
jgi:hypothetical protein